MAPPWYGNRKFRAGTRVIVIRNDKYLNYDFLGQIGKVRDSYSSSIQVVFDNIKNPASKYGSFYFGEKDLEKISNEDDGNNAIKEDKNMEKITGYLNIAVVQFPNTAKTYEYHYANFDPGLKQGDTCVVRTVEDRLLVATVTDILDERSQEMPREVVAKVDMYDYNNRVERRAKAAELKAKMEALAKQLQDVALYRMLAETNPEMAALLEEYQGLTKV